MYKRQVSHCVNDVLSVGGRPLAFLDYIAFGKVDSTILRQVISSIARECRRYAIDFIGGETAELPGVYCQGEYDVVGFIIGVCEDGRLLDGSRIKEGDLIVGIPSNGLHTNGYSLARKVLLDSRKFNFEHIPPGWRTSIGRALLKPHINYFNDVYPLHTRRLLKGIAHITGGGIAGNLKRILPPGVDAHIRKGLWKIPPIFDLIAEQGPVEESEMYKVFNMGIGMILITSPKNLSQVMKALNKGIVIGEIVKGSGEVIMQ